MNGMRFAVHWIPVLAAGVVLALVGFLLRAKLRHSHQDQPAAERRVTA